MQAEGTVIWYRPEMGRGVVRLDGGRQFFFNNVKDLDDIEPLQRVVVINADKGPAGAVVTALDDGRVEFGAPLRPLIRRTQPAAVTNGPRSPDAPPDGTAVVHENYGRGVVVRATAKMVRVRFDEDAKERTIRPSSITIEGAADPADVADPAEAAEA